MVNAMPGMLTMAILLKCSVKENRAVNRPVFERVVGYICDGGLLNVKQLTTRNK